MCLFVHYLQNRAFFYDYLKSNHESVNYYILNLFKSVHIVTFEKI